VPRISDAELITLEAMPALGGGSERPTAAVCRPQAAARALLEGGRTTMSNTVGVAARGHLHGLPRSVSEGAAASENAYAP
jgi:hypothetical protein